MPCSFAPKSSPRRSKRLTWANGLRLRCRSRPWMSATQAASGVLIARQPVYDPGLRVVAYELLVQRSDGSDAGVLAEEAGSISELGLNLVTGHPAYVNVSRPLLLEGY